MYKKLTHSEMVNALWDIRDIPEFMDELTIAELKQLYKFIDDHYLEMFYHRSQTFIEAKHNIEIWDEETHKEGKLGFTIDELKNCRETINKRIDPHGMHGFRFMMNKLSEKFDCKFPTTKYTSIYHYLNTNSKMPLTKRDYYSYVSSNFDLGNVDFKRLAYDCVTDKKYEKHEPILRKVYPL